MMFNKIPPVQPFKCIACGEELLIPLQMSRHLSDCWTDRHVDTQLDELGWRIGVEVAWYGSEDDSMDPSNVKEGFELSLCPNCKTKEEWDSDRN